MNGSLELSLPPLPEYVSTARIFASAAARQFGLSEEAVADLKVAVSEACTGAMYAHTAEGIDAPVQIRVTPGPPFTMEIVSKAGSAPSDEESGWDPKTPTDVFQPSLASGLISTLFPDAQFIEEDGLVVRFSLLETEDNPAN